MRHGIRPPTKAQPIPAKYSPNAWPTWTVEPGLLTERGAKGIGLIGAADRGYFIDVGLLPTAGCPSPGQVAAFASNKPRAIETAEVWLKSVVPGCEVKVDHPDEGASDPLFHALDEAPAWFDGHHAYEVALTQAPNGGLAADDEAHAGELDRLEQILGCTSPSCDLESEPTNLVERPHDRPDFAGAMDVASTASQSLLLEYLEGMPMSDVGWGRATRDDIERLLIFHPIKFKYSNRPPFIAMASAGPIASKIAESLGTSGGPRIVLLAGHDTNLADLGGLLGLHWKAAGYPQDDVPPGAALGFELWSGTNGYKFVRAFLRSQTMDQLRNLEPLSTQNPPYRQYISIPRCGRPADAESCSLATFLGLIETRTH
jgi:4-phytase/acid phosphatase